MTVRIVILAATAFMIGALAAFATLNFTGQAQGPVVANVSGKALIGGPFTMTDHTGKQVTEKDFRGRYMLIFFGFTNCPDICPAELQVMSAAMDELGEQAETVVPVFVTVDPKRDTVERMAQYVSNFHPKLVGLTGTREQVEKMAKAFRIYYAEVKDETTSDGYSVDHSSVAYLMGPKGEYLTHFGFGTKPKEMAERIAGYL